MHDYLIQKEVRGYSVWTAAPATGDRRDFLSEHGSKRGALRMVDRLRRLRAAHNDPNHPLGVLHRVVARGEPIAGVEE